MGWMELIAEAIQYIEGHITEELSAERIAAQVHLSPFYFHKGFSMLCGFTLGEYIRNRRLTLAAQELSSGKARVLDVALKYGYDSPDSFPRAFTRFHGVSPSAAREKGSQLRSFAPLKIKLTLEGGTMLEYRITEKAQFTVMGLTRQFNMDTSYQEIPRFWSEHMKSEQGAVVCGMYGICLGGNGKLFNYMIADNYLPWNEVPPHCETRVIPAGTWAVFPCRGPLPQTLQDVNTQIWSEWLPACKAYRLAGNYHIEMYGPPAEQPEDTYSEIWMPIEKV